MSRPPDRDRLSTCLVWVAFVGASVAWGVTFAALVLTPLVGYRLLV